MSTDQSKLDEYDAPKRPARGGYRECDRPKCGFETEYHGKCSNPVVPIGGIDYCTHHLEHAFDDRGGAGPEDRPVWERQHDDLLGESNE